MKAIIKIKGIEVKFEVPDPTINSEPPRLVSETIKEYRDFMNKTKQIAVACYKETNKK